MKIGAAVAQALRKSGVTLRAPVFSATICAMPLKGRPKWETKQVRTRNDVVTIRWGLCAPPYRILLIGGECSLGLSLALLTGIY